MVTTKINKENIKSPEVQDLIDPKKRDDVMNYLHRKILPVVLKELEKDIDDYDEDVLEKLIAVDLNNIYNTIDKSKPTHSQKVQMIKLFFNTIKSFVSEPESAFNYLRNEFSRKYNQKKNKLFLCDPICQNNLKKSFTDYTKSPPGIPNNRNPKGTTNFYYIDGVNNIILYDYTKEIAEQIEKFYCNIVPAGRISLGCFVNLPNEERAENDKKKKKKKEGEEEKEITETWKWPTIFAECAKILRFQDDSGCRLKFRASFLIRQILLLYPLLEYANNKFMVLVSGEEDREEFLLNSYCEEADTATNTNFEEDLDCQNFKKAILERFSKKEIYIIKSMLKKVPVKKIKKQTGLSESEISKTKKSFEIFLSDNKKYGYSTIEKYLGEF